MSRLARFARLVSGVEASDTVLVKHLSGQHDQSSHGSWAGGVPDGSSDGYAYPIKTAYDNVVAGKEGIVSPLDAPAWLDSMADRTDNPDLTNLEILGTQYFTKDNLGIKRDKMPQIPPNTQEAFIKAMQARGVRVDLVEVTPFGLHPIQAEISASKSGKILRDMKKNGVGDTPITVSSDDYVIDGHHRWAAGLFLGLAPKTKNIKLKALRVDMPQEQLLDVVLAWNKTVGIVSIPLGAENDKKFVMKMLAFDIAVLKAKIKSTEVEKHLSGQHDQSSYGRRFKTTVDPSTVSSILASVKENGGLSIKLTDGSLPPDGYMVGRDSKKFGTVVKASDFYSDEQGAVILGKFLLKNMSELGSGRAYLGVWHETSKKVNGVDTPIPQNKQLVHLDVTDKIVSKKQAMSLGRRRDQISIWDVINFDEIQTGGTGGEVQKRTSAHSAIPETVERNDGAGNYGLGKSGLEANHRQVVVRVPVTPAGLAFAKHQAGGHDQSSHGNWSDGDPIAEGKYGQWGEKRQQEIIASEGRGPSIDLLNQAVALVETDWAGMLQSARDYVDSTNNFTIQQELKDYIGDEQDSQTVEQLTDEFYDNNATDILSNARDELTSQFEQTLPEVFDFEHTGMCADGQIRTITSSVTSVEINPYDGSIKIYGDLHDLTDVNGYPIGEFERSIYPSTGEVTHDLMQFNDADTYSGSGFGTAFIRNSENYYISHGINTIKVGTAWSGAYVWAKMGFGWDRDYRDWTKAQKSIGEIHTEFETKARPDAPILQELQTMYDRLDGDSSSPDFPTPREVAMLGYVEGVDSNGDKLTMWPGKMVLMGRTFHYEKHLNQKPHTMQ